MTLLSIVLVPIIEQLEKKEQSEAEWLIEKFQASDKSDLANDVHELSQGIAGLKKKDRSSGIRKRFIKPFNNVKKNIINLSTKLKNTFSKIFGEKPALNPEEELNGIESNLNKMIDYNKNGKMSSNSYMHYLGNAKENLNRIKSSISGDSDAEKALKGKCEDLAEMVREAETDHLQPPLSNADKITNLQEEKGKIYQDIVSLEVERATAQKKIDGAEGPGFKQLFTGKHDKIAKQMSEKFVQIHELNDQIHALEEKLPRAQPSVSPEIQKSNIDVIDKTEILLDEENKNY